MVPQQFQGPGKLPHIPFISTSLPVVIGSALLVLQCYEYTSCYLWTISTLCKLCSL